MTLDTEARGKALLDDAIRAALVFQGARANSASLTAQQVETARLEAVESYRLMLSFIRDRSTLRQG